MSRILGLDLGSYSVKAILLEATFRGTLVKRFSEVKLSGESPAAALAEALRSMAAEKLLTANQVSVDMPGLATATQVLSLPFAGEKQIEQTVGFEVEGQMFFDLEDIVFDYQPLTDAGEKTDLLVGVVRREQIHTFLTDLKGVGVNPRVVTLPALALNPGVQSSRLGPEAVPAVVDIGHERVSVAIGTVQGLDLARTFAGGGADVTRALARDFQMTTAEAQTWKEKEADLTERSRSGNEEAAYNAIVRALSPVVRELRQTFRSHQARTHRKVTHLLLCGGTARIPGLPELLGRELGVEAGLVPAAAGMEGAVAPEHIPVAMVAQGLAQRAQSGGRSARFNLRRNDLAFKGDYEYLKGKVGRLGVFAAILLAVAAGNSYARISKLNAREKVLDTKLCELTQKVLSKCQSDFNVALSMLREHNAPSAGIPQVSAVELLAETTNRIPDSASAKISEVEITENRVRLRGTVDSFDSVEKLTTNLKAYRCFSAVNRGKTEKDAKDKNRIVFSLDIEVGCQVNGGQG